jgi:methionyl-tRNA synthetase
VKNFYITTTLPYLNADPHMGHALEFIQADVIARQHRLMGDDVVFNTGTDEHGLKIFQKAFDNNLPPQDYVDLYSTHFRALKEKLNLSYTNFIRTTDPHHIKAAQEFWRRCLKNGDIYKGRYEIKYCVGCELEKDETELVNGRCFTHPNLEIQVIKEENYFFKFSKYQQELLNLYTARPDFVVPQSRLGEIKSFVERGLKDFSISRLKSKMSWGIPVPDDDEHVMYVWFDALANYISTLGWPEDGQNFEKWWGAKEAPNALQIAGKDNLRQQSAMWQAMLMSAGLPTSKQIFIHGFITSGGQKMSKTLGNVINPSDLVEKYGTDAVRYVLLRHMSPSEDSDLTLESFHDLYTAHLTNGLGNLVARVMKLSEEYLEKPIQKPEITGFSETYINAISDFKFNQAMDLIWERVQSLDNKITNEKPFAVIKEDIAKGRELIQECREELLSIGKLLLPFIPQTSQKILEALAENKKPENIFPRI